MLGVVKHFNWQPIVDNVVHKMLQPVRTIQHSLSETGVRETMKDTEGGYKMY